MNYNSANANISQQGQSQSLIKETAYFQSLIDDMEVQNKRYSELTCRLESVLQKLANEANSKKEGGVAPPQPAVTGYISTVRNNIDQFMYLNNRAEDSVSKLEKLF